MVQPKKKTKFPWMRWAVLLTIPIIIFVLFFQRRIVAGLTAGGVKG